MASVGVEVDFFAAPSRYDGVASRRNILWNLPDELALGFMEIEGSFALFDLVSSRALDGGPSTVGVDDAGWYADPDGGVPSDEQASVAYDGHYLIFTTTGA